MISLLINSNWWLNGMSLLDEGTIPGKIPLMGTQESHKITGTP